MHMANPEASKVRIYRQKKWRRAENSFKKMTQMRLGSRSNYSGLTWEGGQRLTSFFCLWVAPDPPPPQGPQTPKNVRKTYEVVLQTMYVYDKKLIDL